jgi:endonuclease/exonuclease/phosphatase family metal-dependent hydrolase
LKRTAVFRKIFIWLNLFFAIVLLVSILAKYISGGFLSFLYILSLTVPFFVLGNGFFFLFWLLKKKRKALISGSVLLLGFFFLGPIYQFKNENEGVVDNGLKVMTFNVRGFNQMGQLDNSDINNLILNFIETENPDIVCMQEAPHFLKNPKKGHLKKYNHKFIDFIYGREQNRSILSVHSKYPILNNKIIDFPNSGNSAMYVDLLVRGDTVRLFNIHLESYKIIPSVRSIKKQNSKKLLGRMHRAFIKQKEQATIIKKHIDSTALPKLVVGDFNNTQFSNVYQTIKGDMSDSFFEKGEGFGKTYRLFRYPMRIDYILADDSFKISDHKNYDERLSDHYPVMATLQLKAKQ